MTIAEAKGQIQDLLRRHEALQTTALATPRAEMLLDCVAALEGDDAAPPASSKGPVRFVQNRNTNGKLHRLLDCSKDIHPHEWRTRCGWALVASQQTTTGSRSTKLTSEVLKSVASVFPKSRNPPATQVLPPRSPLHQNAGGEIQELDSSQGA